LLRQRTNRAWFSCLLRHPARKWSASILSTPEPDEAIFTKRILTTQRSTLWSVSSSVHIHNPDHDLRHSQTLIMSYLSQNLSTIGFCCFCLAGLVIHRLLHIMACPPKVPQDNLCGLLKQDFYTVRMPFLSSSNHQCQCIEQVSTQ